MAQRLTNIQPGLTPSGEGVSLVGRGANRRRFLLAKSDEVDTDVVEILSEPVAKEAALLDVVRETGGDESVAKAAAAAARTVTALNEAYADATPEQKAAIAKAMSDLMTSDDNCDPDEEEDDDETDEVAKSFDTVTAAEQPIYKRDFTAEQRRELAKKGHALKDGSYPLASTEDIGPAVTLAQSGHGDTEAAKALIKRRANELGAHEQLPDAWKVNKEDDMPEAPAVPIQKDDGSWDLSAVPEDQRPAFEAVLKSHDAEVAALRKANELEQTKADEAIAIAKAVQLTNDTTAFVAKSAGYENLAKDDSEFGPVLLSIAKAEEAEQLPKGTLEKLETVLKAADAQVEKGALFSELGKTGAGITDVEKQLDTLAADIRKSDPSLTKEQAIEKAYSDNPELYARMREEG